MNLDFGILWIEDTFSEAEEQNLKRRVREAGFIARVDTIPNSQGIEEYARSHSLYHLYDIILLDYRLLDENGSVIAPRIRELFPSTTILFYSGSVEEAELRGMMAENRVEGVYCSARTRFIERTGALIEQTARALDRLSGMRGLAMRVVAECDEIMRKTVVAMAGFDSDHTSRLSELDADVFQFMDGVRSAYENSLSSGIEGRLNTRAVDSAKLFNHFRRVIKVVIRSPEEFGLSAESVDRIRELRKDTANYVNNVLQRRNVLGHVVEVKSAEGWVLSGSSEIGVSDFPDIRRLFAVNIDALREISAILIAR